MLTRGLFQATRRSTSSQAVRTYLVRRKDAGTHRELQERRFTQSLKHDLENYAGMIVFQQNDFASDKEKKIIDSSNGELKLYRR